MEYYRAHWRKLELQVEGLNEDALRKFRTEWDKRRERVEDATEEEEYDLLLRRVGPVWAKRILVEEEKRTRGKFGVKINKVGQFSLRDFSAFLTRILGEAPLSITEDHGWFKVSLASEEQEKKVLSLRGKKIAGGFDLRVFRSNPRMTATEIFSWMTRDVRIQDNMATLDYHPRGVFKRTNSPVREVQAMPQKSTEKNDAQKKSQHTP